MHKIQCKPQGGVIHKSPLQYLCNLSLESIRIALAKKELTPFCFIDFKNEIGTKKHSSLPSGVVYKDVGRTWLDTKTDLVGSYFEKNLTQTLPGRL